MKFLLPFLLSSAVAFAANYYVDFSTGNDGNSGSSGSPWKHSTGDPNATGVAAGTALSAGDIVNFKGGVSYRGMIFPATSGSAGNPITYRSWGTPKAIVDGSEIVTGWTKCTVQADCPGNTNWTHIYFTTLPTLPSFMTNLSAFSINLFQDSSPLEPAQFPESGNSYYQMTNSYYVPSAATTTNITDARLGTLGGANLVGCYVYSYMASGNEMALSRITSYDAGTTTISFNAITSPCSLYAIANCRLDTVLKRAGQSFFDDASGTLWVWPIGDADLSVDAATVTYSARPVGINCNGKDFIKVDGLMFQRQTGDDIIGGVYGTEGVAWKSATGEAGGSIINSEVTGVYAWQASASVLTDSGAGSVTIGTNYIHDTRGTSRGIQLGYGVQFQVLDNVLSNVARTSIFVQHGTNSTIAHNSILNSKGVHANGISVYETSRNATINGNYVFDSNIGITLSASGDITVVNNVVDANNAAAAEFCFGAFGGCSGTNYVLNNTFLKSPINYAFDWEAATDLAGSKYIVENNIFNGGMVTGYAAGSLTNRNNWFTGLSWQQAGYAYGSGEFLNSNTATNLEDFSGGNFRLSATSVGRDSGLDLSAYGFNYDLDGTTRPVGPAWDRGAFERIGSMLYVSTTGNNGNSGAIGSPWRNIWYAANHVTIGDTVNVGAGTFNEFVTNTVSGTFANPITFSGAANWSTIIDPTTALTNGWVLDSSMSNGVYSNTAPWQIAEMELDSKQVMFVYSTGNIAAALQAAWPTIALTTGAQLLSSASSFSVTPYYNNVPVPFWDGVEALWSSASDHTVWLRLRDGSDPNGRNIRVAANGSPAGGLRSEELLSPAIYIGASNIVWQNILVRGGRGQILLDGTAANNVTIRSNYLSGGVQRILAQNGCWSNTIVGNVFASDFYGGTNIGAWSGQNSAVYGRRESAFYQLPKYCMGNSGSLGYDVHGKYIGNGNVIAGNTLLPGLVGIEIEGEVAAPTFYLTIASNYISSHASLAVALHDGVTQASVFENTMIDNNLSIREHDMGQTGETNRVHLVYRNRSWQPAAGEHVYFYWISQIPGGNYHPEIWIYNNSFSGGVYAVDLGIELDWNDGGAQNVRIVNNIADENFIYTYNPFKSNASALKADYNLKLVTPFYNGAYEGSHTLTNNATEWPAGIIPNWSLRAGSLARDAALDVTVPFTLQGTSFPALPLTGTKSGPAWDIGAVEGSSVFRVVNLTVNALNVRQ